jgi:hypothetical protein
MPRVNATAPPDAIRIEEEVWQEAFARREPSRTRATRRRPAVGDRTSPTLEPPAAVVDRTAEPADVPDWLTAAGIDSAPASGAGLRGEASGAGLPGDDSGADPPSNTSSAGSLTAAVRPTATSLNGSPVRRTVTIRGRGAEGYLPWPNASRDRSQPRAYERAGFRPDRLAMWAVLLGFLLVLVAVLSAH